jgi:hypothetical protein
MNKKERIRYSNGYRLLYRPSHPKAMKSSAWKGFVYEHVLVAEKSLCRSLADDEVIHHLDQNRSNNREKNLLVLLRGQHLKIHKWIENGAPGVKISGRNRVNSVKPKQCCVCGVTLQRKQRSTCSEKCKGLSTRKVVRPSYEQLHKDVSEMSMVKVGKRYGVSDNTVRKWIEQYERVIPSQVH